METEYLDFITDYYSDDTLYVNTLSDDVRAYITGGTHYFLEQFKEVIHNIIYEGENK